MRQLEQTLEKEKKALILVGSLNEHHVLGSLPLPQHHLYFFALQELSFMEACSGLLAVDGSFLSTAVDCRITYAQFFGPSWASGLPSLWSLLSSPVYCRLWGMVINEGMVVPLDFSWSSHWVSVLCRMCKFVLDDGMYAQPLGPHMWSSP